jgi:hypothetical protein
MTMARRKYPEPRTGADKKKPSFQNLQYMRASELRGETLLLKYHAAIGPKDVITHKTRHAIANPIKYRRCFLAHIKV